MSSAKLQDTTLIYKNSIVFLYVSYEQSENEIKKTILFSIASKGII